MFKRGLTARELVCKSNISEASISRYLSGKLVPKQGTIQALAEALDVDPVWLLGYDPVTPENDASNDQAAKVLILRTLCPRVVIRIRVQVPYAPPTDRLVLLRFKRFLFFFGQISGKRKTPPLMRWGNSFSMNRTGVKP